LKKPVEIVHGSLLEQLMKLEATLNSSIWFYLQIMAHKLPLSWKLVFFFFFSNVFGRNNISLWAI
jgi:hypothetical protein